MDQNSAPIRTGLTRRQVLGYGAAGLVGLAGAGVAVEYFRQLLANDLPGDIFKGDAPSDEVWELWQKRGWTKECYHYLKLDRNVQCKICPNNCILTPGDRSHCRNKINRNGILYTLAYGNPCSFHVDPVEKKPLFHFLPGSASFSLATAGCIFRCLNCQNWEISQKKPEETKDARGPELRFRPPVPTQLSLDDMARLSLLPADAVAVAAALQCPSIAYTYSEPVAFYEYAYDTCRLAHENKLRNILVTCGSINERPLRDLAQYLDAAHVDLKGFDETIYWKLNTGRLQPVLDTLKTLRDLGVWFEIINLVVPSYTDRLDGIARMCDWLVQNIGPDHPIHFSRFHPAHKLDHLAPTPIATLVAARDCARAAGLRYAYIGNVRGIADAETTFCPGCRRAVIERDLFAITRFDVSAGKCKFCQAAIAGVWA